MAIKTDYIKVRVSTEQKALFKRVAKLKGITMTELLVGGTEERVLLELTKLEGTEILETRVVELEKKLQELKRKMASTRENSIKKGFFYFRFINK